MSFGIVKNGKYVELANVGSNTSSPEYTIPDGSTVNPINDVSILMSCAYIKKDYTTIEQVCADDVAMFCIVNSINSMRYLERCLGFVEYICSNENFMTYLGKSIYTDITILKNNFWVGSIINSDYFDNVFVPLIPRMTSNTEPSGKASCSSVFANQANYMAYKAFDDIINSENFWEADGRTSQWLQYEFPHEVECYILGIDCTSMYLGSQRYTDLYYLQSSSDGINWETILTINPTEDELINYTYYRMNKTMSKYFRWYFPLGNAQGTYRYTHVTRAQLYGRSIKFNDVSIWLNYGDIDKDYTNLSQVLADNETTLSLMNNKHAMEYLAKSEDFADEFCLNETAMTFLGQSPYVDSTVLNSDYWVSAISSSSYWDLIYPPVTVHSSASATITVAGKSFTSDASGNTQHVMPWGTFSISDSVSEQSFECTIGRNTTDVYVMPENYLYWYGNTNNILVEDFTGSVNCNSLIRDITKNTNDLYLPNFNGNGGIINIRTTNTIDLSNYKSISLIGSYTATSIGSGANLCILLYDNSGNCISVVNEGSKSPSLSKCKIEGDINKTTGYYISASVGGVYASSLTIHALWFE